MVVEPALWKKAQEGEAAAGSHPHLGKSLCLLELHRDGSGGSLGGRELPVQGGGMQILGERLAGRRGAGRKHSTRQVGADCFQGPRNLISVPLLSPGDRA